MLEAIRKTHAVLSPSGRRSLVALIVCMVLGAGLAGVGSLYPFAAAAIDRTLVHSSPPLHWLYEHLGFVREDRFLVLLAARAEPCSSSPIV